MYLLVTPKRAKNSLQSVVLILESLKFIEEVFYTDKLVVAVLEHKFVDRAKQVLESCSKISKYEVKEEDLETKQITIVKVEEEWWFNGGQIELSSEEVVKESNWLEGEITPNEEIEECEGGFCKITKPKEYFPPM